ncbi:MAG: ankyrin repeat domain-containing protein [Bacteroidota bacterium]
MKKLLLLSLLSTFCFSAFAQNMYRTACQGKLERLDSLLQKSSINAKDNRGRTLLHWAVACKQKEVFDFLVNKGININSEDDERQTAMHMAVRFNNEPYFDYLLEAQPNTNWATAYGASLLEKAILNENLSFVKKLMDNGIDVNSTNHRGSTPLEIALKIGVDSIAHYLIAAGAKKELVRTFELQGLYMGQSLPDNTPKLFAPNVVSTEEHEFGSVFNAAADEFYYGVDVNGRNEIRYSKRIGNNWTPPKVILSHERYGYNDPFLSPDEKRLYFISRQPLDGIGERKQDHDIWYVEKTEQGWSEPINAGPAINSEGNEYYISFTQEGTMYFSSSKNAPEERKDYDLDIYYSKFIDGQFQTAVRLDSAINTENYEADVFVDPAETYLIFCATRPDGLGRGDLYISFKNEDGSWTTAKNMGAPINSKHHELCPYVTADGKYFMYTSQGDIYWVSTASFLSLKED